jgi:hypothetical protein
VRSAVLLLVAACGRLCFDARPSDAALDAAPCVPVGTHDEDGDGVVDSCDVCPHLADVAQTDTDGDRVGDACDPEIDQPRQRIAIFDPFTSIAAWTPISTVVPESDGVSLGGVGLTGSLRRDFVPTTDTLVIGARTFATGTGQRLFAIIFKEVADGKAFYCELFEDPNAMLLLTYTLDGMTFVHPDFVGTSALANGRGALAVAIDATSGTCQLAWNAMTYSATGARPSEIDLQVVALYAENVDVDLDYFLQIRTDP